MFKTWLKYFLSYLLSWKYVFLLPSPNIFRYNDKSYFLILIFSHTHNCTQKYHSIWISQKIEHNSQDQTFGHRVVLNIDSHVWWHQRWSALGWHLVIRWCLVRGMFTLTRIYFCEEPYPEPNSWFCWALPLQGQGLSHWIQLLEVLSS
jgi:hypothetical protein